MNKRLFRSTALQSVMVVIAVIALASGAAVISVASRHAATKSEILLTQSANDLKVSAPASGNDQSISGVGSDTSGNASSSGVTTLQPTSPTPASSGGDSTIYPCDSCPQASSATDIKICADYCVNPSPTPEPSPQHDCSCKGTINRLQADHAICPMIACPNIY